ncbi:MAG: polysaccharide deacetylase family protein [Clostridia bacterium]|nr:polysaccharide deacetylase family protein [Clostridia bacterium]
MLKRVLALILCLCALVSFAWAEETGLETFAVKHGSRESKKVAITVDDCYKTATEWIAADVELCKQYGIHMTFFPIVKTGCLEEKYRDLWQSVLDAGCEIGCHGYQHLRLGSFDYWTLVKRLGRWQEELDKTLGYHYQTRWLRPPYGSIDGGKKLNDKQVTSALKRYGFDHYVHWEVSETKNMEKALEDIQPGSILLFHSKKKDTRFLEQLIPVLQEQGYEMVTLSELFGFDLPETGEELYVYDRKNYEDK